MQITAYVAGSIALARPSDLALDGLLSYQLLRRHFKDKFYYLPDPKETLFFAQLPLEMRGSPSPLMVSMPTGAKWIVPSEGLQDESLWYWACSSAQIDVKGRDTQHWNKRFDTQAALSDHIDFGGKVEKILIEQGRYKAYHMPLPTLVCDKVVWFAYGDMEKVADLLTGIVSLGKKRNYGNGNVIRIEVAPMEEDWSTWQNNRLMRPIPGPLTTSIKWHGGFNAQFIAFRAPQWHSANQTMCVTIGERSA
jgi:CRISPR type IV-associated protein Csf3